MIKSRIPGSPRIHWYQKLVGWNSFTLLQMGWGSYKRLKNWWRKKCVVQQIGIGNYTIVFERYCCWCSTRWSPNNQVDYRWWTLEVCIFCQIDMIKCWKNIAELPRKNMIIKKKHRAYIPIISNLQSLFLLYCVTFSRRYKLPFCISKYFRTV